MLVHFILVIAPSHPIEFTQLLDKLVHRKHGGRQRLTLIVDVLRALDYFVVKNLVRVDEVGHFAAKNGAV